MSSVSFRALCPPRVHDSRSEFVRISFSTFATATSTRESAHFVCVPARAPPRVSPRDSVQFVCVHCVCSAISVRVSKTIAGSRSNSYSSYCPPLNPLFCVASKEVQHVAVREVVLDALQRRPRVHRLLDDSRYVPRLACRTRRSSPRLQAISPRPRTRCQSLAASLHRSTDKRYV